MSQQQIRARLQSAGYDPSMADPFFGGTGGSPEANASFGEALRSLGIISDVPGQTDPSEAADSTEGSGDEMAEPIAGSAQVFGKKVFNRSAKIFDVVAAGPVDASYRLGAGDQLQLLITGAVEVAYQVEVRRDGTIIVPQIGQIPVAGLTLEAARSAVRRRAATYYNALASGRATLDLTVARVRTNGVFVIGEVESPGAYQVNALATVFHALARAGGPTATGSFRSIELRRGGTVVRTFDLYKYLLTGDASDDIRLEQGDVLFVPLSHRTVTVTGEVRRPATYELRDGEGLSELLSYAGGMTPTAASDRIQIDRILPVAQRTPGHDRVMVDVFLGATADSSDQAKLFDSDIVKVFPIGRLRRNSVKVSGAVFQPGTYEYSSGLTVRALLARAQGMLPWALADRVKITRTVTNSGAIEVLSVDLASDSTSDLPIKEFDEVTVLDAREIYQKGIVSIAGAVRRPGSRPFAERMTLGDVIDFSGGFREGAYSVEVARRRVNIEYSDTTSIVTRFPLDSAGQLSADASRYLLARDDRIYVRAAPGNRQQRFVELSGLFHLTGPFAINEQNDRVSDIVKRAGGTLPNAAAPSFRLLRGGRPVAIDFDEAMRHNPEHDVVLLGGDQLSIGQRAATVFVTGDVERPSLVLYSRGMQLGDYVDRAGGARPTGDIGRAIVEQPTGRVERVQRRFLVFHDQPDIEPGATITVPPKPADTRDFGKMATTIFQVTSSLASLAIAFIAVHK